MKIKKKFITVLSVISVLITSAMIQANAVANVSGGLNKVFDEVKKQAKSIATAGFALGALICLIVACTKLIGGLLENHRSGEPIGWKTIGIAFGATVACSLFASASFFGWFGL